ncbi:MAG: hypothetical protein ABJH07_00675 [Sedimentitalea sp.]|uniref:hypothetical protein n=1 Tax=Sedimentitalea sp. TaxID=2048915 RepID=UPI0032677EE8
MVITSVTHHPSGRIDIHRDGKPVACLSDPGTIGETLRKLGVEADYEVTVQQEGGRDWHVPASAYIAT